LRIETLVIRGGRGAGKSALFHFLGHVQRNPDLGKEIGAPSASMTWVEGFSNAQEHPSSMLVSDFGKGEPDDRRRLFWFAWLCARISAITNIALPESKLAETLKESKDPAKLADAAQSELPQLSNWMDGLNRDRNKPIIVTYDHLDRVGQTGDMTSSRKLTASLLGMWLSLADRYRSIRPKIFVREDLFQSSLSAFPDATKLDARSTSIEWRVEDLYRVLIKHMANTSDDLKNWIESSARAINLTANGNLGWMPPDTLPETGRGSQKDLVTHLAGEKIASGQRKGFVYRWIPNRLQDAHTRVVPRSLLGLIRNAASLALEHGPQATSLRLLTPTELQGALEKTSKRRVQELEEEFPVVARLANLRGENVMLERTRAIISLSKPAPLLPEYSDLKDEFGNNGEAVLQTLIGLGVMSERSDGRIDVPDIYRYGFGILRKGGVKRPR
jgi:hypothetical protein